MAKKVFYQPFSLKTLPDLECYTINYKKKNVDITCLTPSPEKKLRSLLNMGVMACAIFFCDG